MDSLTDILSLLTEADQKLLLLINSLHTPLLDNLMWIASDKWTWLPLYALLTALIYQHHSPLRATLIILTICLTIAATDQTCATIIRPAVQRLRPSNPDNPISPLIHIVNDYRGGKYGFPSCHAANTFALAITISLLYAKAHISIPMITWAAIISYSRIYLGVHYPGDILGGIIVGTTYALIFHQIYNLIPLPPQTSILPPHTGIHYI